MEGAVLLVVLGVSILCRTEVRWYPSVSAASQVTSATTPTQNNTDQTSIRRVEKLIQPSGQSESSPGSKHKPSQCLPSKAKKRLSKKERRAAAKAEAKRRNKGKGKASGSSSKLTGSKTRENLQDSDDDIFIESVAGSRGRITDRTGSGIRDEKFVCF